MRTVSTRSWNLGVRCGSHRFFVARSWAGCAGTKDYVCSCEGQDRSTSDARGWTAASRGKGSQGENAVLVHERSQGTGCFQGALAALAPIPNHKALEPRPPSGGGAACEVHSGGTELGSVLDSGERRGPMATRCVWGQLQVLLAPGQGSVLKWILWSPRVGRDHQKPPKVKLYEPRQTRPNRSSEWFEHGGTDPSLGMVWADTDNPVY